MHGRDMIEELESRLFLSAVTYVTNVVADNRGQVSIFFSAPLNPADVNTNSVQLYTASSNADLDQPDNVKQTITAVWGAGQNRILINANIPANTPYWVVVKAALALDANGQEISGTYTTSLPSGNGTPGGNFRFNAGVVPTNSQIVVFSIGQLRMNVALYNDADLPLTIPTFLNYVNTGFYDGTFIHRTATTAEAGCNIIQGGEFAIGDDPEIVAKTPNASIAQEPAYSNVQGSIALANTGAADSSANQWYVNVTANTDLDGGYSVFGAVTNSASLAVATEIFDAPQLDMSAQTRLGSSNITDALTDVPTFNTTVTPATADPQADFIIVSRVAVRNAVVPFGTIPFQAVLASKTSSAAIFATGMSVNSVAAGAVPPVTPESSNTSQVLGTDAKILG